MNLDDQQPLCLLNICKFLHAREAFSLSGVNKRLRATYQDETFRIALANDLLLRDHRLSWRQALARMEYMRKSEFKWLKSDGFSVEEMRSPKHRTLWSAEAEKRVAPPGEYGKNQNEKPCGCVSSTEPLAVLRFISNCIGDYFGIYQQEDYDTGTLGLLRIPCAHETPAGPLSTMLRDDLPRISDNGSVWWSPTSENPGDHENDRFFSRSKTLVEVDDRVSPKNLYIHESSEIQSETDCALVPGWGTYKIEGNLLVGAHVCWQLDEEDSDEEDEASKHSTLPKYCYWAFGTDVMMRAQTLFDEVGAERTCRRMLQVGQKYTFNIYSIDGGNERIEELRQLLDRSADPNLLRMSDSALKRFDLDVEVIAVFHGDPPNKNLPTKGKWRKETGQLARIVDIDAELSSEIVAHIDSEDIEAFLTHKCLTDQVIVDDKDGQVIASDLQCFLQDNELDSTNVWRGLFDSFSDRGNDESVGWNHYRVAIVKVSTKSSWSTLRGISRLPDSYFPYAALYIQGSRLFSLVGLFREGMPPQHTQYDMYGVVGGDSAMCRAPSVYALESGCMQTVWKSSSAIINFGD